MMSHFKETRCGAQPLKTRQGGRELGPMPQRGPSTVTGGETTTYCKAVRQKRRPHPSNKDKQSEAPRTLNILQWNAEGVHKKKLDLTERMEKENIDIACVQETHLTVNHRFQVRGYETFRFDREERHKGGVLILVRNSIAAQELKINTDQQAEINGIDIVIEDKKIRIYNAYCPPDRELSLTHMNIPDHNCVVVGDFNSHSDRWGYEETDRRGEEVEDWEIDENLHLINQEDDDPTFYSRRWMTTTTPDLAFATDDLYVRTARTVLKQLGGSDHRPIKLSINLNIQLTQAKCFPRWNYKKANWTLFEALADTYTKPINTRQKDSNKMAHDFTTAIWKAATESIPRGARKDYKPYWTEELQDMEDNVSEARNQAEKQPSVENNIALKEATARYRLACTQAARKSWQEKTESLNLDKDGSKLWKLAKALNNEKTTQSKTVLQHNGNLITGRQAADHFIETYEQISTLEVPPECREAVHRAQRDLQEEEAPSEIMTSAFSDKELEEAMQNLKLKKSPGPDGITNEMILHLGMKSKKVLLKIFNSSWKTGSVPQCWKEADMIPIHKNGKDKTRAENYRPISLTSCLGKLMERLVNARLVWHLEDRETLSPEQAGYRQHRSTEDQITYIAQNIEDAFQDKKHTLAVWLDMEKAFDKVWKDGLKLKLRRCGVSGKMFTWISQYLHNRQARVQLQGHKSKKKHLRQGVPQGGVLSPTLFLIFIDDIIKELPRGVRGAIYADDLVLWCSEEYTTTAQVRLQAALNKIETWTKDWLVSINTTKTTFTVFSLSSKKQEAKLTLNGQRLTEEPTPTYLGITFDRRLTWKQQIKKCCSRAKMRLAIMKKLAGTDWGADQRILKKLYTGRVRPVAEYGISAWATAAKSNFDQVNRIQNQAQRIMTGAMKSTPIQKMEEITGLQSLDDRKDTKILMQAAKFKRLESHPMNNRMNRPTKSRLKRGSFVHQSRRLERALPVMMEHEAKPIPTTASVPSWKRHQFPSIITSIPGVDRRGTQSEIQQKTLAMEHICSQYPQENWTHVFTDGSATGATQDGGAGILIRYTDGDEELATPTGKHSTNYRAETEALREAAATVSQNETRTTGRVVVFSDALSALQALRSSRNTELNPLSSALAALSSTVQEVVLQWVPAHCGIRGNERADTLAKAGAQMEQTDNLVTYDEIKTIIKAQQKKKWQLQHPQRIQNDSYHLLGREEQVKIFRLRTGHNRLNYHLHTKLGIGQSGECPCNQGPMTTHHVLQSCPQHAATRREVWPIPATMDTKLYGTLEDLRRTAAFIRDSEVTI